jgi:hypothetical protein
MTDRPLDCPFEPVAINWHLCPSCGLLYYGSKAPRRNCPNTPAAIERRKQREAATAEAAEKLGVTVEHARQYAKALLRWREAGYPTRTADEVAAIYAEHCGAPCPDLVGSRCKKCGCRVASKGIAVLNKIKLATESCPEGKW